MGVRFAILICRSAFRNRLPYMICSEIFESMPLAARDRVYERLYDVLSGKDQAPKYAHLSPGDRAAPPNPARYKASRHVVCSNT